MPPELEPGAALPHGSCFNTSQVGREIVTQSQRSTKEIAGWAPGFGSGSVPALLTSQYKTAWSSLGRAKESLGEECWRRSEVAGAEGNRNCNASLEKSSRCPYLLSLVLPPARAVKKQKRGRFPYRRATATPLTTPFQKQPSHPTPLPFGNLIFLSHCFLISSVRTMMDIGFNIGFWGD